MNHTNSKSILYYSKKCPHCAEVLNKIRLAEKNINNFSEQFLYVLVDGNNKLPNYITEVPTMVVPTHNKPLTGESVFMWIETKLRMVSNQKNQSNQGNYNSAVKPQDNIQPKPLENSEGPISYNPMEMSGFGDSFSFIDNSSEVQEHCFTFIDENGDKQVKCVPTVNSHQNANQNNRPQGNPNNQQMPQWLQGESVGRPNSNNLSNNTTYNPDVNAVSMSHQNNIRLQQQARLNNSGNRQIPNFQDPQRQPLIDNNKISDTDYEKFMNSRNNDPGVQGAPQRI